MPDWIVWLVVGFVVYRFCMAGSGSCCRSISSSRRRDHAEDRELSGGGPTRIAMNREAGSGRAETTIQAAQRRFVEGATTVEEYEAELDRAMRERSLFRATP